jgi:hypothetical protein
MTGSFIYDVLAVPILGILGLLWYLYSQENTPVYNFLIGAGFGIFLIIVNILFGNYEIGIYNFNPCMPGFSNRLC